MNIEIIKCEILGIPTDFEIKTERTQDGFKQTISYWPPRIQYDPVGKFLVVMPPIIPIQKNKKHL